MPTLFTDPRSGGVKKSSGVNVLPIVAETWAKVRDDTNAHIDWLIAGFDGGSTTDITILSCGMGGLATCASSLPRDVACYGGVKLEKNSRFVTFYHVPDGCPVMMRGRGVYLLPTKKNHFSCIFIYILSQCRTTLVLYAFCCTQRQCTKMVNSKKIAIIKMMSV
jgi:hypothetical protein